MKRYGDLFEKIVSYENMLVALKKALKGAGKKYYTAKYWFYYEKNLQQLIQRLKNGSYHPKKYKSFNIHEPKERVIHVADFEDRIVHHAIISILEPIYEKIFIYDSYATRKNKGTHKAVYKAQKYFLKNYYYLKTDIRKYFPSVRHDILLDIIKRKIKCKKTLSLIKKIIYNHGELKGLPIGNLTSQFFANVYLDKFDHYIKDESGIKNYVRYMDDLVWFSNDKNELKELLINIREYLYENLKLELKPSATFINSKMNGLPYLGTRIFEKTIRIKKENLKRSLKKIKLREYEYYYGIITEEKLQESVNCIMAHLDNYSTKGLIKSIFRG